MVYNGGGSDNTDSITLIESFLSTGKLLLQSVMSAIYDCNFVQGYFFTNPITGITFLAYTQ